MMATGDSGLGISGLLTLSALSERALGLGFSALGFLPAVLALTLYSMLPVVRNTITGLMTVPRPIREAAAGVGMTEAQAMRLVELPLAMPVIMAGVPFKTVGNSELEETAT